MEPSQKWKLSYADVCRWAKNSLLFLGPVILIYLVSVQAAINDAGFQFTDFAVTSTVAGAMILYVVNIVVDVLRKLGTGPKA